jgi:hypothetical protein
MEKAGGPWQVVYSSASLASIQAAVQAGLGISILGKSSVLSGMCVISPRAGLPALPDSALALYSRKSPFESLVRSLSTFVANAIAEWQKVTNPRFVGAYAEYALASAAMVSRSEPCPLQDAYAQFLVDDQRDEIGE